MKESLTDKEIEQLNLIVTDYMFSIGHVASFIRPDVTWAGDRQLATLRFDRDGCQTRIVVDTLSPPPGGTPL